LIVRYKISDFDKGCKPALLVGWLGFAPGKREGVDSTGAALGVDVSTVD